MLSLSISVLASLFKNGYHLVVDTVAFYTFLYLFLCC